MVRRLLAVALLAGLVACEDPWADEDLDALGPQIVFASVDAGLSQSCGLDVAGKAWCWGLAAGTDSPQLFCAVPFDPLFGVPQDPMPCWDRPVAVRDGHRFKSLVVAEGGGVTYAIEQDGSLWGWGFLWSGATSGGGVTRWAYGPERVPGTSDLRFASIDASNSMACGLTTGGAIWCWGQPNMVTTGAMPACVGGLQNCFVPPTQVGTATDWTAVQVGQMHACALNAVGRAYCWGESQYGQLGVTVPNNCNYNGIPYRCIATPTLVSASLVFTKLSADGATTCGLLASADLYCWGWEGNQTYVLAPTLRMNSVAMVDVFGQPGYCVVRVNGAVYCAGLLQTNAVLVQMTMPTAMVGVAGAHQHACAWNAAGEAYCFGQATYGEIGDGVIANTFSLTARKVSAPYKY